MEDSDHVYFFFRESAVEYINCGKVNTLETVYKVAICLRRYLLYK